MSPTFQTPRDASLTRPSAFAAADAKHLDEKLRSVEATLSPPERTSRPDGWTDPADELAAALADLQAFGDEQSRGGERSPRIFADNALDFGDDAAVEAEADAEAAATSSIVAEYEATSSIVAEFEQSLAASDVSMQRLVEPLRRSPTAIRWGSVKVSPERGAAAATPPAQQQQQRSMHSSLVMADTEDLVRSFERSVLQSPPSSADSARRRESSGGAAAAPAAPPSAASVRFYALLEQQRRDRGWQQRRASRLELHAAQGNLRAAELERTVRETMSLTDLANLRFSTKRKLAKGMKSFVGELRTRMKGAAFAGWSWAIARARRDREAVAGLRSQRARTQLLDMVAEWRGMVGDRARMRVIGLKLERKLGAISVSRVWWAWHNAVRSNDKWRRQVAKATAIVYRSLLRSRLRHWHGVVLALQAMQEQLLVTREMLGRHRLAVAMDVWLRYVVERQQSGPIDSVLQPFAARWDGLRVRRAFVALWDWRHLGRRKRRNARAVERCLAAWRHSLLHGAFLQLAAFRAAQAGKAERLRVVGVCRRQRFSRTLARCLATWRLEASASALLAEAARSASETELQAVATVRAQLQAEMAEAQAQAARAAQEQLDAEVRAREAAELEARQANASAAAAVAAVQDAASEARRASEAEQAAAVRAREELQRLEAEEAAAATLAQSEAQRVHEQEMAKAEARLRAAEDAAALASRQRLAAEEAAEAEAKSAEESRAERSADQSARAASLRARSQRRCLDAAFGAFGAWCAVRVARRRRLFAAQRKLSRSCLARSFGKWRSCLGSSTTSGSAGSEAGADAWFDELPAVSSPGDQDALEASGYMEPAFPEASVLRIQAAVRGHLVRRRRRAEAKQSAARLKTLLRGCGLSERWPQVVRHQITVRMLLEMRVGQMQTLGWGSAERRRLLAALRLERPSLQRWLDGQANTATALPPSPAAQASTTTLSTPGAARSPAEDF